MLRSQTPRSRRRTRTAVVGLVAAWMGAQSLAPARAATVTEPNPRGPRPNLLLITLDTTRADFLSCYGFPLPTSPYLDALARRGVRFETAVAQVPLTGPSHATILTGLYPHRHGAIRNGVALRDDVVTATEVLREAGYRTAAFLSGWTLRANLSGLAQGFDDYDDRMQDRYRMVNGQRFAHQVTPLAVDWMRAHRSEPFFLWVHYFDPHSPYSSRPELYEEIGHRKKSEELKAYPERNLDYASEIRHVDTWVGVLLEALREEGLEQDTLVVVAGDHGEALGEHGYVGHGRRVYEEILKVPLMLSWPGRLPEGMSVPTPVALLDVTPTVLPLLGLEPPPGVEGIDLGPLMDPIREGRVYADRQIRFETYPGARKKGFRLFAPKVSSVPTLVGYREGSLKFVYDTEKELAEVFDLAGKFGERVNIIDRHPSLRSSGEMLLAWIEATERVTEAGEGLSEDDAATLKSLGY